MVAHLLEPGTGRFNEADRFHNLSAFCDYENRGAPWSVRVEGFVLRLIAMMSRANPSGVPFDRLAQKVNLGGLVTQAELDRTLRNLTQRKVLAGENRRYRMLVDLFSEWVRRREMEERLIDRFRELLAEARRRGETS